MTVCKKNKFKSNKNNIDELLSFSFAEFFTIVYMICQSHNKSLINEYVLDSDCTQHICCHCDHFIKYTVYIKNKALIQNIDDNILISADHEIITIITVVCRH